MTTLIDESLAHYDRVVFQAGTNVDAVSRLSPAGTAGDGALCPANAGTKFALEGTRTNKAEVHALA